MNRNVIVGIVALLIIIIGAVAYLEINHTSPSSYSSSMTSGMGTSSMSSTSSPGAVTSPLIVYVADAYAQEASYLDSLYANSTGVAVAPPKGGGSFALAREIGQGNPDSVFMSVALNAYSPQYMASESPGWAIAFVADQLVIAYSNATLQNPEAKTIINDFNEALKTNSSQLYYYAFSNLTSGHVKVGISNPDSDPAGFRAWIVLEIAGYVYAHGNSSYFEDLALSNKANVTASNAAQLVSPLESGQIQFLFIYKSAAIAKGLNYIVLPPWLNLGNGSYSSFYSKFTYNLATGPVRGSPIYLFISVPKNASDYQEALNYVIYVVQHSSVLEKFGLIPLSPALLYNSTSVPPQIEGLLKSSQLKEAGTL